MTKPDQNNHKTEYKSLAKVFLFYHCPQSSLIDHLSPIASYSLQPMTRVTSNRECKNDSWKNTLLKLRECNTGVSIHEMKNNEFVKITLVSMVGGQIGYLVQITQNLDV